MKEEQERPLGICGISYERNNYYYGKLMTVRDFLDEQRYFNEKRWLINRMVSGWGVVCGLEVVEDTEQQSENEPKKVIIKTGFAIDCWGREILVCHDTRVKLDPKKSTCPEHEQEKDEPEKKLVICLEYRDCRTERLYTAAKICDQDELYQYNRIKDSFVPVVRYSHEVNKHDHHKKPCPLFDEPLGENKGKNLHEYVCEKLSTGCPDCPKCPCLVVAEITVSVSDNNKIDKIEKIDLCSKRKIVYNNPLLFDLINCYHGDLPHIDDISWIKLHGRHDVKWDNFEKIIKRGLKVTFDKIMEHDTINRHTFLVSVFTVDESTGERDQRYIPAKDIEIKDEPNSKGIEVTTASFEVRGDWLRRIETLSQLKRHGGTFEIIMRGSSIMGKNGKALDAEFIGGKLPTGNGNQGGDFVSWFHVEKKPYHGRSIEEVSDEMEEEQ